MTKQVDLAGFTKKLQLSEKTLDQAYQHAFTFFRDLTPYRSGNAYRNTHRNGSRIVADYPYAQRLDTGWSQLAPRGMSADTVIEFDRYLKSQLRKIK